ncbi:MAG: pentapeptide repeat-containing protein, partial [Ktedonobacterales bacterium]
MSEQAQRLANNDRASWQAYWSAQGMPWRAEPEIDEERQRFLAGRRQIESDFEHANHPFEGIKLDRADIEWLLTTHESRGMRGPVDASDEKQSEREGLNLAGVDLQKSKLDGLPLARATFNEAHLEQTNLSNAQLEEADFQNAHLEAAVLIDANLKGAALADAHLVAATLWRACLNDANFEFAHMEGVDLSEANLQGTNFTNADLEAANLSEAHLQGSVMHGACLAGAYLFGAHMEGADLSRVTKGAARGSFPGAYALDVNLEDDGAHLE